MRHGLLATAACALALASATPAYAQVPQQSLRIMTYNSYMLSPFFRCVRLNESLIILADCLDQIDGLTESWADRLATAILIDSANIDMIALNEVWDEDAKKILKDRLSVLYPVQVTDIDKSLVDIRTHELAGVPLIGGVRFNGEDSGLMFFAKADFRVLPLPDPTYKWGANSGETLRASTSQVAFNWFKDCGNVDCYSAKGAAMIRLQHGTTGPIYNVVFTHMQADYPEDNEFYKGVRLLQFNEIRKMVEKTLAPVSSHTNGQETILVLGDLNVPYLEVAKRDEWRERFKTDSSFFTSPLIETYYHTSSQADHTETNEVDHERLDYILASPKLPASPSEASRDRCVQHVTVPVGFRNLESDHNAVRADINRGYFYCAPAIAFRVDLDGQNTVTIDTQPTNSAVAIDQTQISAGTMQWFEVKEQSSGTWSIGPDTNNVKIDVFLPEDMTTPVSRYNKTAAKIGPGGITVLYALNQYALPRHFFIRASGIARTTVSDYSLRIHRHTCATKQDACILQPELPMEARLSASGDSNPQNQAWFRFDAVGAATSGKKQVITVRADNVPSPRLSSTIDSFVNPGANALAKTTNADTHTYSGEMADGGHGYLKIVQSSAANSATVVKGTLGTSLRAITIGNLTCVDETNPETGSDDIFTRVDIDGTVKRAPSSDYVEFDCDNPSDTKPWASRVGGPKTKFFIDHFAMRLIEDDDTSENDDSMRKAVPELAPDEVTRDGRLTWHFDDGKYYFNYTLTRRVNEPVADQ